MFCFVFLPVVLAPKGVIEQLRVCLKRFEAAQVKNGNYNLISKDVASATMGSKEMSRDSTDKCKPKGIINITNRMK